MHERKDCVLAQRIRMAESALECSSAKKGRAPASWEELEGDTDCGVFGITKDLQGRRLEIRSVAGKTVVTDADGNRGGNCLVCGPGVIGLLVVLLILLGATTTIVGVGKKRLLLVLLGLAVAMGGVLLNHAGPIG